MYKAKKDFLWFKEGQKIDKIEDRWLERGLVEKLSVKEIEVKITSDKEEPKPVKKKVVKKK